MYSFTLEFPNFPKHEIFRWLNKVDLHYPTPLRPTSKWSSARVERPSSARRANTCRAAVEHRRALDGIFLAWHRNGLILHFCATQKNFRRALDGARRPLDEYTLDERSRVARPERSTPCSLASVV